MAQLVERFQEPRWLPRGTRVRPPYCTPNAATKVTIVVLPLPTWPDAPMSVSLVGVAATSNWLLTPLGRTCNGRSSSIQP